MVHHTSFSRPRSKWFWGVLLLIAVLSFALSACGGSSNPSTATIYIDEHPGVLNDQDAPQLDQFWFANSKTDQTFTTSYTMSLAPGGKVTLVNQGDDPQKVTVSGPNNYSTTSTIAAGPGTSTSIQLPTATGDYTVISDPTTSPKRNGARGGLIHVG